MPAKPKSTLRRPAPHPVYRGFEYVALTELEAPLKGIAVAGITYHLGPEKNTGAVVPGEFYGVHRRMYANGHTVYSILQEHTGASQTAYTILATMVIRDETNPQRTIRGKAMVFHGAYFPEGLGAE